MRPLTISCESFHSNAHRLGDFFVDSIVAIKHTSRLGPGARTSVDTTSSPAFNSGRWFVSFSSSGVNDPNRHQTPEEPSGSASLATVLLLTWIKVSSAPPSVMAAARSHFGKYVRTSVKYVRTSVRVCSHFGTSTFALQPVSSLFPLFGLGRLCTSGRTMSAALPGQELPVEDGKWHSLAHIDTQQLPVTKMSADGDTTPLYAGLFPTWMDGDNPGARAMHAAHPTPRRSVPIESEHRPAPSPHRLDYPPHSRRDRL